MRSRDLATVTAFASLYAVTSLIVPGFPVVGIQGISISPARALEIIYGILLGPLLGPIAAFTGSLTGKIIVGGGVGLLTTPLAALSAFSAACIARRRVASQPGWILGSIAAMFPIAAWYLTDTGRSIPGYPALHILSVSLILILRGRIPEFIRSTDPKKIALGVSLTALPSTLTGQLLGNVIFIVILGTPGSVYAATLPLAMVERTILMFLAVAVGAPLLVLVRRTYPGFERD